jgi:NAD(P)-dependent dehydrogenase (short-subunit alcohol dehydrogenase family)
LLRSGYTVAMADINDSINRPAAEQLAALGSTLPITADVGKAAAVEAMVHTTLQTFGRLDALVNNAGIGRGGPIAQLTVEDWHRVLSVNLTAGFLAVKHAENALRHAKGSIVFIASTRALMSEPNSEAYAASKGGVVALTHALAASLAHDVRVNCVSPGWIDTRGTGPDEPAPEPYADMHHAQHLAGRIGQPQDIASLVAYLCSEKAGFITGQNFVVDGGMTRKMIYVHDAD